MTLKRAAGAATPLTLALGALAVILSADGAPSEAQWRERAGVDAGGAPATSLDPVADNDDASAGDAAAPIDAEAPDDLLAVAGGALCGDPRLSGSPLEPIPTNEDGCGVDDPVRIDAVDGVAIAPAVQVDCALATRFADFVSDVVAPEAEARFDAAPVEIRQVSGYVCRSRNRQEGAPLSEHALGHAIDIASITLADGVVLSVYEDWGAAVEAGLDRDEDVPGSGSVQREYWRALWDGGCALFGTVLGPHSDVFHRDHIHLDVAERRSSYCR